MNRMMMIEGEKNQGAIIIAQKTYWNLLYDMFELSVQKT